MDEHGDKQGDEQGRGSGASLVRLLFSILGLFLFSLVFGGSRRESGGRGDDLQEQVAEEHHFRRQVVQGWFIVCGIAVAFVLYGLFAFVMVGDKGPPDWDFGSVEDIPGQSVYSTYPYRGRIPSPEPQHVNQKPAKVETGQGAAETGQGKAKTEEEKGKTEEGRGAAAGEGKR